MNLADLLVTGEIGDRARHALDAPAPADDGAADHRPGTRLPETALPATSGGVVELSELDGRSVVYAYPRTGVPDEPVFHEGWDQIPGARGCTPESCAFRDHHNELAELGVDHLFGMSTQTSDYQREAAERLHLPFALLSDVDLAFGRAMRLPTFEADGMLLLKRLTMIVRDGTVETTFYPVFPPDRSAGDVIAWLASRSA